MSEVEIQINQDSAAKVEPNSPAGTEQQSLSVSKPAAALNSTGGASSGTNNRSKRSMFEPQEAAPQSLGKPSVSRKPSTVVPSRNTSSPTPSADPTSPGSRPSAKAKTPWGDQLKPLKRTDSNKSSTSRLPPSSPAGPITASPVSPKESAAVMSPVAVKSPVGSRTGSVIEVKIPAGSETGSQAGGGGGGGGGGGSQSGEPEANMSRQGSAASRGVMSKAGSFVQSLLGANSDKGDADDDLAGVDWKLTAKTHNETIEKLRSDLDREKSRTAELNTENRSLKEKVSDLEHQVLEAAHHDEPSEKEASGGAKKSKALLAKKDARIKELEVQLRSAAERRGSTASAFPADVVSKAQSEQSAAGTRREMKEKERRISELQSEVERLHSEKGRTAAAPAGGQIVADLRVSVQQKDVLLQEAKAAIKALETKLRNAQEAIVSATDYGWENDIKLAQARRALASILEHHSPGRLRDTKGSPSSRAAQAKKYEEQRAQLASRLEDLAQAKAKAVSEEDYAEAQTLHKAIAELKEQLAALPEGRGSSASPSPSPMGGMVLAPASPQQTGAPAPVIVAAESPKFSPNRYAVNTNYGYRNASRGAAG